MMRPDELRPGEALVLRLMPEASAEEREAAYQNLLRFGRMLLDFIDREQAALSTAPDSPDLEAYGRIPSLTNEA
jgi:hypothetical protein